MSSSNKHNKKKPHINQQRDAKMQGTISINSRGKGFFRYHPEGAEESHEVEIPAECTNTALHGDTVRLALSPRRKHFPQTGEVLEVLERAKTHFVGTFKKEGKAWYLDPDDRRMYTNILLTDQSDSRIKEDYKALVELVDWNDPKASPTGSLVEVIGKKGEHETEMRSVVLSQGFDYSFPHGVESEAKDIGEQKQRIFEEATKTHKDLRALPTFTIDPWDAKDFDDALSVQTLPDGSIEVGIHIADVSTYVAPDDPIDHEAQDRATSVYLVDRTIPMLPEVLSNDVCSLNPGEDKLAFSAMFTFDANHNIIARWFGQTIINSDKRFTYEEAQENLDAGTGPMLEELTIARDIARTLRKERFQNGAIAFETEEIKFKLDEDMKPIEVMRKTRQETNMLIEDWMLLANREVATFISEDCKNRADQKCVCVYRIHDEPDPDRILELATFVEAMGYSLEHKQGIVTGKALNSLFKQIEGTEAQDLIETTAIRSMAKAIYSLKNVGHFGLAFKHYVHFTSPIRRYPDLLIHRILKRVLAGQGTPGKEYLKYERLAKHSSEREVSAAEAERDSVKYKQVEYMKDKVGQIFEGKISGITDFGIFVEEDYTRAEGLIRLRDLTDDYYQLAKKGLTLIGERTGKKISLCDRVKVKLVGVDLEHKLLDWKLVK